MYSVSGYGLDRANTGQSYSALDYPSHAVYSHQDAVKFFGTGAEVKTTYRNDPKAKHVLIPKWLWHGVSCYQGMIQGVPRTVTEMDVIKFCQGYGKLHSFLLEKGDPCQGYYRDDPQYHMHNGRFMVKYYNSEDLCKLAAACDQHKGGFEIRGHSRFKLFFKCTWVDFLSYIDDRATHSGQPSEVGHPL